MLLFTLPVLPILLVYIMAAALPAIILLVHVYRSDTVEKEPGGLLLKLLLLGVPAAFIAILGETIGSAVLSIFFPSRTGLYNILLAFLVVATSEEGAKFLMLKSCTWKNPNFNYRFDAIVYSAFVSLGFAIYENLKYVFSYGLSVALPRALFAIPGHLSFSVFMGVFYGRAKLCANRGDTAGKKREQRRALLSAMLLHGFYDTCALSNSGAASAVFFVFVAALFLSVRKILRKESSSDDPI